MVVALRSRISLGNLWLRAAAIAALLTTVGIGPAVRAQTSRAQTTIVFYGLGDTNIADLWSGTILPDFQKAYPQYRVKFVNLLHGDGAQGLVDRIVAARNAGKQPDIDVLEGDSTGFNYPVGKAAANYFTKLDTSNVPNIKLIDPAVQALGQGLGIAYRSSAVTLAYNTQYVSKPPTTYAALLAWIKANPGKFTYCRPEDGGSGGNFVMRAIEDSMPNPSILGKTYDPSVEKSWTKAWALLRSIEPNLYKGGFHPNGNLPVLNLLGRGTLWMATAWSDQGLQAKDLGTLPPTIQFTQINPPFEGGPSFMAVPQDSQNHAGALALLNFTLRPAEQGKIATAIEGFPGIRFKYLPAKVLAHFGALTKGYDPIAPLSQYGADIVKQWAANVPLGR